MSLNNCVSNSVIQVEEVSVQFTMDKKEMEERHTLVQKMVGIISIITIMFQDLKNFALSLEPFKIS